MKTSREELYCSLLYQLLDKMQQNIYPIMVEWSEALQERPESAPWTISKLQEVLKLVLLGRHDKSEEPKFNKFFIFIDALDEADDYQPKRNPGQGKKLLEFLNDLLKEASNTGVDIRICISKRHFPSYSDLEPNQAIIVEHHIRPSVEDYITSSLKQIQKHSFRHELNRKIKSQSTNQFTWPNLIIPQIIDEMSSTNYKQILDLVDRPPEKLYQLYNTLLGAKETWNNRKTGFLLQMVRCAMRPMRVDEFRHALAFSKEFGDIETTDIETWEASDEGYKQGEQFESYVKRESRGLIDIYPENGEPSKVRFIHGTVSNFLSTKPALNAFGETSEIELDQRYHLILLKMCLRVLNFCKLDGHDKVEFVDYASEHWVYHAQRCDELLRTVDDLPLFLDICVGTKEDQVFLQLQSKLQKAETKEWHLLGDDKSLLVLLATMGCTHLLERHCQKCRNCKDACSPEATQLEPWLKSLQNAIISGWPQTVKWLLEVHCKKEIDALNLLYKGQTLLYKASYYGYTDVVNFLLDNGANPCIHSNKLYEYPLHAAIATGNNDMVRTILDSQHTNKDESFKISRRSDGYTAMHMATASGQDRFVKFEVLKTLLKHAPKGVGLLDIPDQQGESPLSLARGLKEDGAEEIIAELEYYRKRNLI
jgi:hypothetical protein